MLKGVPKDSNRVFQIAFTNGTAVCKPQRNERDYVHIYVASYDFASNNLDRRTIKTFRT